MMGSGKTYWAQRLSEALLMEWIDLDAQIEKTVEMSVKDIFETYGELYFREKERDTLRQLGSLSENLIVATGGGTPCFFHNMQWMNENGITFWLNVSIDTLYKRLKTEIEQRPLLHKLNKEELKQFLTAKNEERKPFYQQAKYCFNENEISLTTLKKTIQLYA